MTEADGTARARREYDAYAGVYDQETRWYERVMLGDGRSWACAQARGAVLEVAIGTGRNLSYYPPQTRLCGVDLSSRMLARARDRAHQLTMSVHLVQGDAQALPFADAAFDTVVCVLGLSSIPDDRAAVGEMHRVLRNGGCLLLLGHVASPHAPLRAAQRLIERAAANAGRPTDQQTRQVIPLVHAAGFSLPYRSLTRGGIIERLVATKR